ncbi:hypothetical protein OVA26_01595 [Microbacterium sp. SL62]|uniref:hypothetical protein n=1 Tax=Microbacterium sp. SL62 TaxID=2995139 RepID=UPI002275E5C4|nr:hypothetical protein [Microbacterium sp. SL62]MCY1715635.1 hypothetical protein [Microbacterium sp. SL62]
MTLTALRDDALRVRDGRTEVRLSLPWIRALPLASLLDATLHLDGEQREPLIALGPRRVEVDAPSAEDAWWYLQDRVVFEIPDAVAPGVHQVSVSFRLEIPYLPGGPDEPLRLPFRFTRELETNATVMSVSADVGSAA